METNEKLMLLQGIDLIQSGLNFIENIDDYPSNGLTHDVLDILRNRFQYFRECALSNGECDHFTINNMENQIDNVQYSLLESEKVKKELKELRSSVIRERAEV